MLLNPITWLSLTGLGLGVSACLLASSPHMLLITATAVVASGVLDAIDGPMARRLELDSPEGAELDTLNDLISFVVAPALMTFHLHPSWQMGAASVFFVLAGALRLSAFRSQGHDLRGLPTTMMGGSIAALCVIAPTMTNALIVALITGAVLFHTPVEGLRLSSLRSHLPTQAACILSACLSLLAAAKAGPFGFLFSMGVAYSAWCITWTNINKLRRLTPPRSATH